MKGMGFASSGGDEKAAAFGDALAESVLDEPDAGYPATTEKAAPEPAKTPLTAARDWPQPGRRQWPEGAPAAGAGGLPNGSGGVFASGRPHVRLKLPGWLVEAFARHRQRRCKLALRASSYLGRPSEPPRGWTPERFARVFGARGGRGGGAARPIGGCTYAMAAHQPGSRSRGRPFSARAGGREREADAPRASLYLKGLTANQRGGTGRWCPYQRPVAGWGRALPPAY